MPDLLTVRVALELVGHEAIVQEAYLDSENIWTWGVGVTDRAGLLKVAQFKDNPASLEKCIEVYVKLLREKYAPDVLRAFGTRKLSESEFAAALSFHYNTGAILRTDWVKMVLVGNMKGARAFLETHYLNDGALKTRRMDEAALFFDGKWKNTGKAVVYPVSRTTHKPLFKQGKLVDISAVTAEALKG